MTASSHFAHPLEQADPAVAGLLAREARRQRDQIELIASENIVSRAVLAALGGEITNKTVEGYPGRRYHGGAHIVDEVESLAIARACELFGCAHANVQIHSGSQANQAVFVALLQPGDTVLSMELAAGGHLSHGAPPNLSGRWFNIVRYGVNPATGLLDYEVLERLAEAHRPKLVITGGSAYPRTIDFARIRAAADRVGATFLVDMAHIAGLVAGAAHPSPIPHAHIVSGTTTKTLRGPRGGYLLTDDAALARRLDAAVFPGTQGSIHLNVIAGKAVCFGEALRPDFKTYARQVVANARALAAGLEAGGLRVLTGGTDTHLLLVDVSGAGLTGDQAEKGMELANLTGNKNALPGDPPRPSQWTGVRLGTSAGTTRGLGEGEFDRIGRLLAKLWHSSGEDGHPEPAAAAQAADEVAALARRFSTYPWLD